MPNSWENIQQHNIKDARIIAKQLIAKNTKWVRLIKFGYEGTQPFILDICEHPMRIGTKRYAYGSGIDSTLKDWCVEGAHFSFAIPE